MFVSRSLSVDGRGLPVAVSMILYTSISSLRGLYVYP